MSRAFVDALVENWEPLEGRFGLPDPDDEHVVAAALIGGAGVIVTEYVKDFPPQCIPEPIKIASAAEFTADTVAVSPDVALRAVQTMTDRFSAPQLTIDEILDRLGERYDMAEAANLIRAAN